MLSRKANLTAAAVFFLGSAVAFAAGGMAIYKAGPAMFTAVHGDATDGLGPERQCLLAAIELNLDAKAVGAGRIEIGTTATTNLEPLFGRASTALLACRGFELESFCAGLECVRPGLQMVFRPTPKN